jgi:hypothetical protein
VWVIAAVLHIPFLLYVWFAQVAPRIEEWQDENIRAILVPEIDRAQPMSGPRAPPAPKVAAANAQAPPPAAPVRALPTNVIPGIPEPGVPTVPPAAERTAGAPGGAVGGTGRTLTERLTAPADPILFGRIETKPAVGIDAVRERLATSIQAYNDSVAAEVAAAERATDWTVRDKDGKRWGVSPGKLHLGDITLPLPLAFQPPPGRRDEYNSRIRSYNEIEQQSARAQIKDSFEERVKEIRKRKEQERAEKRKAVTTGGNQ